MAIPSIAFLGSGAAAAGGGGGLLSALGGFFGGPVGGSLLGGALGGLTNRLGGKSGGFNRALSRSIRARRQSLRAGVENFENFFPRFREAFGDSNPLFAALEQRALSDLNDENRTARLESAFMKRLQQEQSSRGVLRAPTSALQTSFAGLQFNEAQRQQAFQNAMGFQQALGQPLAAGFFQAGLPNIQADIGFQQQLIDIGQDRSFRQSIASGISEGLAFGQGNQAVAQGNKALSLLEKFAFANSNN